MQRPDIETPRSLFESNARYLAPVFQRLYTWTSIQLDPFFEDLDDLLNANLKGKQFLGAIVLQHQQPTNPGAPKPYLIIDGQQRLTTVYLFLLALAELIRESRKDDDSISIIESYLAINTTRYKGEPKLVPTAQDRESFYEILRNSTEYASWSFGSELPAGNNAATLRQQWQRIRKGIRERLLTPQGKVRTSEWRRMCDTVLDGLEMVCITLDSDEDPNIIFSRLNARGTPLGIADLTRNSVFSRFDARDSNKSELFYTDAWLPFERSFTDAHKDALESYFQPFSVIRTEGRATQATAYAELEKRWAGFTPSQVLNDLKEYAPYFISLTRYQSIPDLHTQLNQTLRDFAEMPKLSVAWPFIIQLLHESRSQRLDWRSAETSLRVVESMLVRRALIGWEPTGLHTIFKDLWHQTRGDPKKVANRVQTSTIKTPDDENLRKELKNAAVDGRKILPYVLKQLERNRRQSVGTMEDIPAEKATIEHIAPQSYSGSWQNIFANESEHAKVVSLLGNLTLVPKNQNQKLSNLSWTQKAEVLKSADWQISRELANKKRWDTQAIRERTRSLTEWILLRWPDFTKGV